MRKFESEVGKIGTCNHVEPKDMRQGYFFNVIGSSMLYFCLKVTSNHYVHFISIEGNTGHFASQSLYYVLHDLTQSSISSSQNRYQIAYDVFIQYFDVTNVSTEKLAEFLRLVTYYHENKRLANMFECNQIFRKVDNHITDLTVMYNALINRYYFFGKHEDTQSGEVRFRFADINFNESEVEINYDDDIDRVSKYHATRCVILSHATAKLIIPQLLGEIKKALPIGLTEKKYIDAYHKELSQMFRESKGYISNQGENIATPSINTDNIQGQVITSVKTITPNKDPFGALSKEDLLFI